MGKTAVGSMVTEPKSAENEEELVQAMFADTAVEKSASPAQEEVREETKEVAHRDQEPSLKIMFADESGKETEVVFTTRPLGFKFMDAMPLVVTRAIAGSAAEALGVKGGMTVLSVSGKKLD